jgi:hypothetical protein
MSEIIYNRLRCFGPLPALEELHDTLLAGGTGPEEPEGCHRKGAFSEIRLESDPAEGGPCLIADYTTPWGPPDDADLTRLSRAYPEVRMENIYAVWWTCSAGRLVLKDGYWVDSDHLAADIPKEDWIRQLIACDMPPGMGDPHTPVPWRLIGYYLRGLGWEEQAALWLTKAEGIAAASDQ